VRKRTLRSPPVTEVSVTAVIVFLVALAPLHQRSHLLDEFPTCVFGRYDFVWSADSRRVYFGTDAAKGAQVALIDVAGRALRFEGLTGHVVVSPHVEHVAWVPASGFPSATRERGQLDGDELHIDDHKVWGSTEPEAARIWAIAWRSDTMVTFCGDRPKPPALPPRRYRAVIAGKHIHVVSIGGACPPSGPRWADEP